MQGLAIKINQKKEVKLKCQENVTKYFFKEMVVLRLKRIIPMILLYDANKVNLHSCSSFFCMR